MTNSPFTTIALILLMVVAFYFLILRPQKKRQQAQQKTMNELTPGTRVLLGSGLFGTHQWVGSKQAILEVAPGVEMTVLKQAIARVVTPGDEYANRSTSSTSRTTSRWPRRQPRGAAHRAHLLPAPVPTTDRRADGRGSRPTGRARRADRAPQRTDVERTCRELGNDLNWQHQAVIPAAY